MKKRLLMILVIIAVFAAVAVYAAQSKPMVYSATLSGAKEVPSVTTKAKGDATFTLSKDAASISYSIKVSGLEKITAAHIHTGAAGTNGPVVVMLFPAAGATGPKGGVLAKGVITSSSLVGPLKGKKIADLLKDIKSGDAYVNVHTKAHKDGEIRGWITAKP